MALAALSGKIKDPKFFFSLHCYFLFRLCFRFFFATVPSDVNDERIGSDVGGRMGR